VIHGIFGRESSFPSNLDPNLEYLHLYLIKCALLQPGNK
jgi:hypothetical protein